jgi:hypothetical protein
MAKLHELLAVSGNLKGQADTTRKDLKNTFEKKRHLFEEEVVTFVPSEDGVPSVTEKQKSRFIWVRSPDIRLRLIPEGLSRDTELTAR